MSKIKKSDNAKGSQRHRSTGTKSLRECKMVQSLCKTVKWLLIKLNIDLPYHPASPLLVSQATWKYVCKKSCSQIFITNIYGNFIHNHQKLVTTQIYLNREMDEPTVIHIHTTEYWSTIKKINYSCINSRNDSNALGWVEGARLKRLHTVWFNLYDILEEEN